MTMYNRKIIMKNRKSNERLELSFEEFKIKFAQELQTALNLYIRHNEQKNIFLTPFLNNKNYESDFYSSLRFNFNNNSISAWYIDRIL